LLHLLLHLLFLWHTFPLILLGRFITLVISIFTAQIVVHFIGWMSASPALLSFTPSLACAAIRARSFSLPLSPLPLSSTGSSLPKIIWGRGFTSTFATTTMRWP